MRSILITGCNRGLGLGLIKRLLNINKKNNENQSIKNLIATCRNVDQATELNDLANTHDNLHVLKFDIKDVEKFDAFAKNVENIVGEEGLNVLINNAGYSPKFTRIALVKYDQLINTFAVNTFGPILLTKALLPLIKRAVDYNTKIDPSKAKLLSFNNAAIINTTSQLGSISSNQDGGFYPYRCSKAALNMATKSLSIDLKDAGILVTCVHPGWVRTDMGGKNALLDVETSCADLVNLFTQLSEKHHGKFYQHDGKELPW